jgi:hypothetical protein
VELWAIKLSIAVICLSFGFVFQTFWVLKIVNLNFGKKKVINSIMEWTDIDTCPYRVQKHFWMSIRLWRNYMTDALKIENVNCSPVVMYYRCAASFPFHMGHGQQVSSLFYLPTVISFQFFPSVLFILIRFSYFSFLLSGFSFCTQISHLSCYQQNTDTKSSLVSMLKPWKIHVHKQLTITFGLVSQNFPYSSPLSPPPPPHVCLHSCYF